MLYVRINKCNVIHIKINFCDISTVTRMFTRDKKKKKILCERRQFFLSSTSAYIKDIYLSEKRKNNGVFFIQQLCSSTQF